MFFSCWNLTSLDVTGFNTANVTDMNNMFYACSSLTSLDVTGFNTANVTEMFQMFAHTRSLTSLDLSSFNTENVTNMKYMFHACDNLTTIYVSDGWSVDNVEDSYDMFWGCNKLVGGNGTKYDPNHLDVAYARIDKSGQPGYLTGKIMPREKSAYALLSEDGQTVTFYYDVWKNDHADALEIHNTYGDPYPYREATTAVFDASFADYRPTSTAYWFQGCYLTSVSGLENLCTDEVTDMQFMFYQCSSLTSLDLWSFNTAKVTDVSYMFANCFALKTIYASAARWNMENVTTTTGSNMFNACTSLVGGNGTAYDEKHRGYEYACIDTPEHPGYLTDAHAYAMLSENGQTVTFYYDDQMENRSRVMDINRSYIQSSETNAYGSAKTVVFDASFANYRPTSTAYWFQNCFFTTFEGLENLHTDEVTDMSYMFYQCSSLTSLDLSSFNTENVTDMRYMFRACLRLEDINLSSFNTAKVTDMKYMFWGCKELSTLDLSSFNTTNVTDMNSMFLGCNALTTIYVGDGWNVDNLEDSNYMFYGCESLVGVNGTTFSSSHIDADYAHIDKPGQPGYLTGARKAYAVLSEDGQTVTFYYDVYKDDRSNVLEIHDTYGTPYPYKDATAAVFDASFANYRPSSTAYWFQNCSLTSVSGLENLRTDDVTDMQYMFASCGNLTSLDLSGFNTENVTDMSNMFQVCWNLTSLDLSSFNTGKVTDMSCMFQGCILLSSLDLSSFDTGSVTNMNNMFSSCRNLQSLDLSGFNTENVTDMGEMFNKCSSLSVLDLSGFNPENVTNMSSMFYSCESLTSLDLSGFNTENATKMNNMFQMCSNLTSLDLSDFNTKNVKNMSWMFANCSNLTSLDLSGFNTENVTNMSWMFASCSNLQSLDLSGFNTENVTYMGQMFNECSSLSVLDLSSFNTANVTDMGQMFNECSSLSVLDLSSFNTANVTKMEEMFRASQSLQTIYVDEQKWSMEKVVTAGSMFDGCTSLVGGNGTTFSSSHTDAEYACVDTPEQPGYFTAVIKYNIYIAKKQVTIKNCDDVLGDGTVSYNPGTNTLTLTDATIQGSGAVMGYIWERGIGIYSEQPQLTINVQGVCTVTGDTENEALFFGTGSKMPTITGDGTLKLVSDYCALYDYSVRDTLTIGGNVTVEADGGIVAYYRNRFGIETWYTSLCIKDAAVVSAKRTSGRSISGWNELLLEDGHQIAEPSDAYWDAEKHAVCYADGTLVEIGKWINIGNQDYIDGIASPKSSPEGTDLIYNLAGQRIGKDYKGIVIKNGRKVLVK